MFVVMITKNNKVIQLVGPFGTEAYAILWVRQQQIPIDYHMYVDKIVSHVEFDPHRL